MCSQLLANDIQLTTSLVGPSHSSINSSTPIRISPTEDIGQKHYDLVIIAPLGPVPTNGFDFDDALIQWLVDSQRKRGAVASVCTGAFLVAATGLLDQRRATTHWKYASQFRQQFPLVDLQIDSMLTHDGTLFCSGGAYAFQDLCLYLIETFFSRSLAEACSRLLMIDLSERSQLRFAGIQALKEHSDEHIIGIQNWMEDHLDSFDSIEELANRFNMSSRNQVRRFKTATDETPSSYLQKLRIEKAKHLLQTGSQNIEAIAGNVGYQDIQYFRTLFKKLCGQTPKQFRQSKLKR
ncbi:hypothetical protein A3752_14450 [Oleiphilus sp. HI0081]|uniref:GlxA family transcriptional regulator n=2 Tax=Oleiphilus TaxID=141450 RepID=UPI0007C2AB0A|nr:MULTISPECIES: helix-turn-helix domain-containing protein [unclassified Oleiphilus]KZY88225.1 hypothetical protein A3741_12950 [Oleiphilus sp. HI0069]KZY89016.1 hypothetical protein A3743_09565 [Oleiphilus sp. HI0072]KZZ19460.1 hypothetical protein A3752_14450 [Oleiphilus sp. HI0081]KZZ41339.1 hypothetical protein A3755_04000 [Oleiphilus sp. HI0085]KZY38076.1 hypothetical protein A3729_16155 [Oleiphilus sp. HI0043]